MERGFIQGKLEIKFLLLYILSRAEEPMDLDTLTDVAMCDNGVSYFDFTSALAELVGTRHVTLESGRYTITDKGRKNGAVTEDELPYSVCLRCDQKLAQINERLRREKRVRSALAREENGSWRVTLELLDGEDANLFSLSLTVPMKEDANRLISHFRADPKGFFKALQDL